MLEFNNISLFKTHFTTFLAQDELGEIFQSIYPYIQREKSAIRNKLLLHEQNFNSIKKDKIDGTDDDKSISAKMTRLTQTLIHLVDTLTFNDVCLTQKAMSITEKAYLLQQQNINQTFNIHTSNQQIKSYPS